MQPVQSQEKNPPSELKGCVLSLLSKAVCQKAAVHVDKSASFTLPTLYHITIMFHQKHHLYVTFTLYFSP